MGSSPTIVTRVEICKLSKIISTLCEICNLGCTLRNVGSAIATSQPKDSQASVAACLAIPLVQRENSPLRRGAAWVQIPYGVAAINAKTRIKKGNKMGAMKDFLLDRFTKACNLICELTEFGEKDLTEVFLSLGEELGELCAEIKIDLKVLGTAKKIASEDGIYGEAVDLWICCVSYRWTESKQPVYSEISNWNPVNLKEAAEELRKMFFSGNLDLLKMERLALQIALTCNPSVEDLLAKIDKKLSKWAKNTNFTAEKVS